MNFYVCSTPYHIFLSLCHLFSSEEEGYFYLTTHDSKSEELFYTIEKKLRNIDYTVDVKIRKRSIIQDRIRAENIKDLIEYYDINSIIKKSKVYIFPWNPYSLYTISSFIYKKSRNVTLVEDGSNLYAFPKPKKLKLYIKKYIYGVSTEFYKDEKVNSILVQFPRKYPNHLQNKVKYLDVNTYFEKLTDSQKEKIVSLFLPEKDLHLLRSIDSSKSIVILSQPLSEDGLCSEDEKISSYRKLVDKYRTNFNIVLKKHPRERTNYNFDDVLELDGEFPSEVFTMLNFEFEKALGICTSAINLIRAKERLNVDENFFERKKVK
jgi:hypothetical protein